MRELACFAGAGGGLLGSTLLGWDTVCAVEIEPYCRRVLMQRQLDGCLPVFPIWDDIRTFDGKPWRGCIDVVSGGFPCQDISSAGSRRGLAGNRSGLWFEMLRVIGEVRPAYVFAENSPMLRGNGLVTCLQGLAGLGYDVAWGVLGAWHVGAPHRRNRMWIVAAHPDGRGERVCPEHAELAGAPRTHGDVGDTNRERNGSSQHESTCASANESAVPRHAPDAHGTTVRIQQGRGCRTHGQSAAQFGDANWWGVHRFAGVDDGMANRLERVKATGNGQVPIVAATAWEILSDVLRHAHQHGGLTT